ncbi:hypothetical protein D3C80_1803820 [compost metagenome]
MHDDRLHRVGRQTGGGDQLGHLRTGLASGVGQQAGQLGLADPGMAQAALEGHLEGVQQDDLGLRRQRAGHGDGLQRARREVHRDQHPAIVVLRLATHHQQRPTGLAQHALGG